MEILGQYRFLPIQNWIRPWKSMQTPIKKRSTEGAAPFVDVTEYFNREYLDEIGSTGMSNVIPGILTGFGILGTFIGLISGISGFDTVSSEVIMGSITNLLGGMEDAFGTSICGVVYSLAFSILYKAGYESANKQMENFAAAFHSAGLDSSEKTTEIQLLHYQQQQTEQIQNLSVVILKAISDTMKTELIPIFSDMQQSMREYICHAGQQQKESLDQIVHEFIRQMIRSLKGQFDALAETLDRTEKCQSHALVQMQKIVDGVITSSDQLKQINEDSRRTVEQMKNYTKRNRTEEKLIFWLSYSDMMAALLMIFVLILSCTLMEMRETYEAKQAELAEQKQIIAQQQQIDQIVGIREDLIDALSEEFADSSLSVKVDAQTGAITFDSNLLFAYNKDNLQAAGKAFLAEFLPKYFSILLDEDFSPYVAEIIIEGHTDDDGDYIYNLRLSQNRAFAVASYCLDANNHLLNSEQLEQLRVLLTANGRSYSAPIRAQDGSVDKGASRRVEIKFRLKDEEMINQIAATLEGNE